jgi:RimJ/RimL family protein N-acetyltransferase
MTITTERLVLRELTQADLPALAAIQSDPVTMWAYEHGFSDDEVQAWMDKQLSNYRELGFGLWAVIVASEGAMIGLCGLTRQRLGDGEVSEIGYQFNRAYWGRGYAIEAARACRDYAFDALGLDEVFSIVRDTNLASMNVAIRNGMVARSRFVKHYRDVDMPHFAFSVRVEDIREPNREQSVGRTRCVELISDDAKR